MHAKWTDEKGAIYMNMYNLQERSISKKPMDNELMKPMKSDQWPINITQYVLTIHEQILSP